MEILKGSFQMRSYPFGDDVPVAKLLRFLHVFFNTFLVGLLKIYLSLVKLEDYNDLFRPKLTNKLLKHLLLYCRMLPLNTRDCAKSGRLCAAWHTSTRERSAAVGDWQTRPEGTTGNPSKKKNALEIIFPGGDGDLGDQHLM